MLVRYGTSADLWTLGVCAFHWATGKLPYSSDAKKDNEDAVSKLTLKAEYKKENYHLTKSNAYGKEPAVHKKEKECFTPNLLELCEGLHIAPVLPGRTGARLATVTYSNWVLRPQG